MAARRKGRDRSGHLDPYYERRRRYEAALRPLGLWEGFARMPRAIQEFFWRRKNPDPVLEFDHTFPPARETRALRAAVEAAFRGATIRVNGAPMAVREFVAVVGGLKLLVDLIGGEPGIPEPIAQFLQEAKAPLEGCFKQGLMETFTTLVRAVNIPLLAQSRIDGRLLSATIGHDTFKTGKVTARVVVCAAEPQVRRATLDGAPRPVYRVARTWGGAGVTWVSWDARHLDVPASRQTQEQYPVYVQSHALRQLRRRVNLPVAAPYLEGWLAESLSEPRIVERHGADLLVEYRLKERRIGYLVVTPVDGIVVVRTFKFLTMEQTPEARMLERRLRLTRRDVDWLSLNELSAFTHTDLRDDPVLRAMLEECGCGHLFDFAEGDHAPEPKAYAAEVRRYLCIAA